MLDFCRARMKTKLYLTIDTELSPALFMRYGRDGLGYNLDTSIFGQCEAGAFGIGYQMDVLDAHGLRGVFFVDPMPAMIWGTDAIRRIVRPLVERGHDVELHLHTEWLAYCENPPIEAGGTNINDYSYEDQVTLLAVANDLLVDAGAAAPTAFRAGNYGADDATLRALAAIGIAFDSSFNPGMTAAPCRIALASDTTGPVVHEGIIELPITAIKTAYNRLRHAQICALSWWEMRSAIDHAISNGHETFTAVSHSFELLNRARDRPDLTTVRRFHKLCEYLAARQDVLDVTTFAASPVTPAATPARPRLAANPVRTLHRISEQAYANWRYKTT